MLSTETNMKSELGKIIKFYRAKYKIKQEVLCKGICTSSYLSRIENSKLIADDEIYHLLFEKLNINFRSLLNNNFITNEKLENIYMGLLNKNGDLKNMKDFFEDTEKSLLSDDLSIKYQLVYSKYLLLRKQFNEADSIIKSIEKIKNNLSQRNYFLFISISIYKSLMTNNLKEGLELIADLDYEYISLNYRNNLEKGVFYYNIALCYCKNKVYYKCIQFCKTALKIFSDIYLPNFELNCHILLGIAYNNITFYNQSIHHYEISENIINSSIINNKSYYLNMIFANTGYNYESQGEFELAEKYYLQAIEISSDSDFQSMINLVRLYYIKNIPNRLSEYLHKLDNVSEQSPRFNYQIQIFTLLMSSNNVPIETIHKLQKESIQYFKTNDLYNLAIFYNELFARIYKERNLYKIAYELLEDSLYLSKKLMLGGE
ncbi:helix-turn-helix transcriptional regulator [Solibacillus sp.]|uniref:helix-turn-helix transcriptional regulator n=1 Tax=Solibacillus sp. TaxID=1909654 RepID=UPI0033158F04